MFSGKIPEEYDLWHRQYGHLSSKNLQVLMKNNMVLGLPISAVPRKEDKVCEACITAKQTRESFSMRSGQQSSRILELVHSDVCGPMQYNGVNGERYFVSFIDDCSKFTVVYLMRTKAEVYQKFREYEAMVCAKFGVRVSKLRCDNGGEYKSREFQLYCKQRGIQMEWTNPYTPEQNGTS